MTTAAAHLFEGAVFWVGADCDGACGKASLPVPRWKQGLGGSLADRPGQRTRARSARHLPAVLSPAEIPRRPTKEVVWPKRYGPTRICSTWHRGRHILLRDAELSRRGPMPGGASGCRTGWNSAAVGLRAISERCVRGG